MRRGLKRTSSMSFGRTEMTGRTSLIRSDSQSFDPKRMNTPHEFANLQWNMAPLLQLTLRTLNSERPPLGYHDITPPNTIYSTAKRRRPYVARQYSGNADTMSPVQQAAAVVPPPNEDPKMSPQESSFADFLKSQPAP